MELRNCSIRHFIRTIRDGLVIKVSNIDPHGRPVPRFKSLHDVYDSENAKKLQKPPSGSTFKNKQKAKHKSRCSQVAPRKLQEVKPEPEDFAPSVDDDDLDSDLDDSITLSHFKSRFLSKKRKCISTDEKSKQDCASVKTVEDGSDLYEPLINLKPKHSKATRAKRRRLNSSDVSSATIIVSLKSEENPLAGCELAPVIRVKSEPDAEQFESQNEITLASSAGQIEVLNLGQKIHEYVREPLLYSNKFGGCLTNEISNDQLEDIQPISALFPVDDASIKLLTLGSSIDESLGYSLVEITKQNEISEKFSSITSYSDDPDPDVTCHSSSSLVVEDIPKEYNSGSHVPDMAIHDCMKPCQESNSILFEDKTEANILYELNDSQSSPGDNCSSNLGSITTSSSMDDPIYMKDDTITVEEQLSRSSLDIIVRNKSHSEVQNELSKGLDKQSSALPMTCAENEYYSKIITCDDADTMSTPEHQHPERLFSTRKAFSPSSEEQLCLAMKSVEIWNDSDQNKCKGKLFENQTRKKPSSLKSEVQYDKKTANRRLPGQVSQQKVVISPRRVIKRSQIAKGNLEGPRLARTLPNLSTGCTSVQGCSEVAVAFSQRQMHDMESVAVKLMNELKSMKDIVEQKLLFEAYRNVSLRHDADEVKSSINNATRAEEMARKWMSMMARDCNRFCKIMTMMPDNTSSEDTSPRGKRKISFADEAGGKLCHVRFFDISTASPASDVEECGHHK